MHKAFEARRQRLADSRGTLKTPTVWFRCDDPLATVEPPRPPNVPADYVWRPWRKVAPFGSGHELRDTIEAGWSMPGVHSDCG